MENGDYLNPNANYYVLNEDTLDELIDNGSSWKRVEEMDMERALVGHQNRNSNALDCRIQNKIN
ncbi:MAG: hypothetical protein OIN86_06605 [Candidatus Methanoperedens sp.]|nr:hypothetical protein [Candidatus Methanoperedens sp.]CAG0955719.1 hypothetical protein METP1_00436 [Methanosarcinales archaeon]